MKPPLLRTVLSVAVMTMAMLGCQTDIAQTTVAPEKVQPSPIALQLHNALHQRAAAQDIEGFQALLTSDSVALLNAYFDATRIAHTSGQPAVGWSEFVEDHAKLPKAAYATAPYGVVGAGSNARLTITTHSNARFFREIIHRASAKTAGGAKTQ